jgi:isopenicillin-N N-acyltransferase-like protein
MKLFCLASSPGSLIRLEGTSREHGVEHGRRARADILENLEIARRALWKRPDQGSAGDADRLLGANEEHAARRAPELLDEIAGIAWGAGVDYRDILHLNLPVFLVWNFIPLDCTQILVGPPATADGQTYLAKTRDIGFGRLRHVVLHRTYPDGREAIEVSVAGSITWPGSGLHSHGLAFSTSGVWSRRMTFAADGAHNAWLLTNTQLLMRDSGTVDEFVDHLRSQPRWSSMNLLVTDGRSAVAIEATPDRVVSHEAAGGVLIRTNHFLDPGLAPLGPRPDENPSSYHRFAVAQQSVTQSRSTWTRDTLVRLLTNHDGYPEESICRHQVDGRGSATVYASIADVTEGHFTVLLDSPCQALAAMGTRAG